MNTAVKPNRYNLPEAYTESYSADDKQKLEQIYTWLNADNKHSKSLLARAAGIKDGTNSSVLSGNSHSSSRGVAL